MLGFFRINFFVFFVIIFLSYNNVAYAYLDPGSGSFIMQSILAVGASIFFYLGYPIRLIKSLINKIFKKKKTINTQENNQKK
tara:strand:- start:1383 stop:1628 length:246 start_codon:yes stop_codon:yes gene_type:complete